MVLEHDDTGRSAIEFESLHYLADLLAQPVPKLVVSLLNRNAIDLDRCLGEGRNGRATKMQLNIVENERNAVQRFALNPVVVDL